MKEASVSRPVAPPTDIPITIEPSADELMTGWLAKRVKRAIEIVIDSAARSSILVKEIAVFGHDYYDNSHRTLFIWVSIDAPDAVAYEFWGVVVSPIYGLNQPPPPGAKNPDVRLEVTVDW
jgi:hypothetical protein